MTPERNETPAGQHDQEAAQQLLDARQALIAERFGCAQDLTAELFGSTTDTQAAAAAGREARR